MVVEFKECEMDYNVKDIYIRDNNKVLKIFYGNNGDLYFDIFGVRKRNDDGFKYADFKINVNDSIFPYFNTLYNDILECHVFDDECLNDCLRHTNANSNLVTDERIIFYSDSIYDENANILMISRIDNDILLEFIDNPNDYIHGFSIRISNSGSKYKPFNICFMKLFNELLVNQSLLDNVNCLIKKKSIYGK